VTRKGDERRRGARIARWTQRSRPRSFDGAKVATEMKRGYFERERGSSLCVYGTLY